MRTTTRMLASAIALAATVAFSPPPTAATSANTERDPVIVVAGTGAQPVLGIDLTILDDRLAVDGYDARVFYLPGAGLGDVEDTAAALPPYVDQVLAETGATQVDLVGHSQGGVVSRYYIKYLGGESKVDSLVSLGAPHYGSQLANLAALHGLWDCLGFSACRQATVGSPFLAALNGDDDTFGDVTYTNIATRLDTIVVPYQHAFLRSPDAVNVTVQDQCPLRVVGHVTLATDGAVYTGIEDALAERPVTLGCAAL